MLAKWLFLIPLVIASDMLSASDERLEYASQLAREGNFEQANTLYMSLAEAYPDAPEPLNNMAVLEAQLGNLELAKEYLEMAISAQKGCQISYDNMLAVRRAQVLSAYRTSLDLKHTAVSSLALKQASYISTSTQMAGEKPVETIKYIEKGVALPPECPTVTDTPASAVLSEHDQPTRAVLSFLSQWAKDWSNRDVDAYIGRYITSYPNDGDKSHADWVALRRKRLLSPEFIKVALRDIQIETICSRSVVANFTQHYQSNT